ncbi:FecR family protein [Flexithrix dorotheae]|uniref:FecR family protein n=1 Tax=Flexithrix dorotheae TaxID=70993 RepID=UPI00037A46D0|nr:FecR family protein [Flexithrix dorotheae]
MDFKKIKKYFNDTASDEEAMEVIKWIKNPDNEDQAIKQMESRWDKNKFQAEKEGLLEPEKVFQKVKTTMENQEKQPKIISFKSSSYQIWKFIAAAVVLFFIWSGLNLYLQQKSENSQATHQVIFKEKRNPDGKRSIITLSDKTKIWLNSGSSLRYPNQFAKNERVVYLTGEAYFEVTENKESPFKVISGDIETTALGTSFNITAFPNNQDIEVALTSGKVKVSSANNKAKNEILFLEPGENIIYNKDVLALKKGKFDPEITYWKDGIIYFKNAGIKEISEKLSRWYGVKFQMKSEPNILYNGSFERKSLGDVLEGISIATGIQYELKDKSVTIF